MILKIAIRNVLRQKRRSILTILTMFGGFTLAAFSIGWSEGTYTRVIDMFTRNRLGHIQVHREGYLDRPSIYKTIDQYETRGRRIAGIIVYPAIGIPARLSYDPWPAAGPFWKSCSAQTWRG